MIKKFIDKLLGKDALDPETAERLKALSCHCAKQVQPISRAKQDRAPTWLNIPSGKVLIVGLGNGQLSDARQDRDAPRGERLRELV